MFSTVELTATATSASASIAPSLDQRRLRLGQDPAHVVARQRFQLDADRQPPLQFRQQVRGLCDMERAGGDEQDVVGLDRAVLGRDRGAFDQRQQVALHALA